MPGSVFLRVRATGLELMIAKAYIYLDILLISYGSGNNLENQRKSTNEGGELSKGEWMVFGLGPTS